MVIIKLIIDIYINTLIHLLIPCHTSLSILRSLPQLTILRHPTHLRRIQVPSYPMPPSRSLRQQRQDVNSSSSSSSHRQRHQKKTVLPVVTPKIEVAIPSLSHDNWHKAKQLRNLWRTSQVEYRFPALSFPALLKSPPYNSKKKWTTQEREAVKNRCILVERRIAAWYDGEENKLM